MATQPKIAYCIWSDKDAGQIVDFYASVFPYAKLTGRVYNPVETPSGEEGTVLTANFELRGQQFMVLSGGPKAALNPSISFMVACETAAEVDELWNKLSKGGKALMPLDKYPFSDRYGWVEDQYGVSWQLMLPRQQMPQPVMPSMLFVKEVCGKAEEAIQFYTSLFREAKLGSINRYPAGMEPDREGTVMYADFMLEQQWFVAMDSAHKHDFSFNESISFMVYCENQEEIDYYWDRLTAGGQEIQCGWLRDKYGVAWQVAPTVMLRILQGDDRERAGRAMKAMMTMVKLDIATLEQA